MVETMTVEERAKQTCDNFIQMGYLKAIEKALRDQIEECANIVAGEASLCSKGDETGYIKGGYIGLHDAWLRIRALAAPTEQTEGKGGEHETQ
jgi:hypothetical protein